MVNAMNGEVMHGMTVQKRLMLMVAGSLIGIVLLAVLLLGAMRSNMVEDRSSR